jgi:uncharacterized protein YwqG
MWSRSELEDALREAGLGAWAPRLVELARPCIILVPASVEGAANAPLGASRLGGEPDMPAELDWPLRPALKPSWDTGQMPDDLSLGRYHWLHRLFRTERWKRAERWQQASERRERSRQAERHVRNRDWPLSFVAQIDFAELHAVHALDGFPVAGRLLLFCDPFHLPSGERDDQPHGRALFTEQAAEALERRRSPPEFDATAARELMPEGYVFKPRILRPTAWLLPPPENSREVYGLKAEAPDAWAPDQAAFSAYRQFWSDLFAEHPDVFGEQGDMIHQVGGIAFSIQNSVEAECAKFAGDPPELIDDWQLVLQIDSDSEAGMTWGDVGRLYLCARKRDLMARRFDQCWMDMQCY